MTESSASSPKPAPAATAPKAAAKPAAPAAKPAAKALAKAKVAAVATPRTPKARPGNHPNLGLAPIDLTAGFPAASEKVRADAVRIAAAALEAAVKADPTMAARYDEIGLRQLLRDGELLVERLATCLASGRDGLLADYAEWIGPIVRRRGVAQADIGAICAGIREALEPDLGADEFAAAARALDAAGAVFKRNGRLGGDRHKRNALLKWMYRGV